jgi:UDP-N-acetyl-D-mannosaminuronate dehydrogenase
VGLGYVGLPLAVSFAEYFKLVGFDKNSKRVEALKQGIDYTGEVENREKLLNPNLSFTDDPSFLKSALEVVGKNLTKDSVVVYESIVYPKATEEVCVLKLEKESGF